MEAMALFKASPRLLPRIRAMLADPTEAVVASGLKKLANRPSMLLALAAWAALEKVWVERVGRPRISKEAAIMSPFPALKPAT